MGKRNTLKQIPKSLLNLRFKAPQGRGPFQIDREYQKIRACNIWRVAVQYASRYGQNTFYLLFLLCIVYVFLALTLIFGFPKACKPFQSHFFNHKKHTEHILYS